MALTLVALWLGRRAEGVRAGAVVGAVAFLAFFTKQIGLVAVVPALCVAGSDATAGGSKPPSLRCSC